MRRFVPLVVAVSTIVFAHGSPAHAAPFQTADRPQLIALADGVQVTPILTAGDVVGDFQYTGVPDGIGVYQEDGGNVVAFVNHELSYRWGDVSWARVSRLELNPAGKVLSGGYAIDGTEGYEYFCSGTLAYVGAHPWYFAGEEWYASRRGGVAFGIDAESGKVHDLPQFGHLNHENVLPLSGMSESVVFLSEDSFRNRSQAYAYFAPTLRKAIHGEGELAAFVPDDAGDGEPSANDLAPGETMSGTFQTIPEAENLDGPGLNAATEALTPFNFIRIEDAAADPATPGVVYFADTGSYRSTSDVNRGRIYRLTLDPMDPRDATLQVVLDGDAGDPILNPDNLGISGSTLMVQEDHNRTRSRYNRVWAYDLAADTLTAVARTDPTNGAIHRGGGKAVWESSGIVDASAFFGPGSWLLNVQAHHTRVPQQGIDLKVGSAEGQGGQLVLLRMPTA